MDRDFNFSGVHEEFNENDAFLSGIVADTAVATGLQKLASIEISGIMASTVIVRDNKHGNRRGSYVRCESTDPFEMPPTETVPSNNEANDANDMTTRRKAYTRRLSAAEVNETLNLNLALPIDPDNGQIRGLFRSLSNIFSVFEEQLFAIFGRLPLSFKQRITKLGWMIYFPLHRLILGRRTGIHPDASLEYHALTTLLHWGRLFPVTIDEGNIVRHERHLQLRSLILKRKDRQL